MLFIFISAITSAVIFTEYLQCVCFRQWLGYGLALFLLLVAIFMVLTRLFIHGNPVVEVTVFVPPPMNRMEQLLAVQNAISHAEGVLQDGAIVLLKIRALILSMFPQVCFPSLFPCWLFVPLLVIFPTLAYYKHLKCVSRIKENFQ